MKHWMFCCKDVSQKISESMDRTLPLHHRMFIRIHILMCKYCLRFRRQLLMLRETARKIDLSPEAVDSALGLSQEAQDRMKKAIEAQST